MGKTSTPLVGLALGMCLTVFGCSDSTAPATRPQSSASSAAPTITKADLIVKAEQICHKYNTEAPAVGGNAQPDPASRNAAQKAVVNLFHQNMADLRALGYPPGDQATLEQIYNGVDAALDDVARRLPVDNIEQALTQALDPWGAKLLAYGINCDD